MTSNFLAIRLTLRVAAGAGGVGGHQVRTSAGQCGHVCLPCAQTRESPHSSPQSGSQASSTPRWTAGAGPPAHVHVRSAVQASATARGGVLSLHGLVPACREARRGFTSSQAVSGRFLGRVFPLAHSSVGS